MSFFFSFFFFSATLWRFPISVCPTQSWGKLEIESFIFFSLKIRFCGFLEIWLSRDLSPCLLTYSDSTEGQQNTCWSQWCTPSVTPSTVLFSPCSAGCMTPIDSHGLRIFSNKNDFDVHSEGKCLQVFNWVCCQNETSQWCSTRGRTILSILRYNVVKQEVINKG